MAQATLEPHAALTAATGVVIAAIIILFGIIGIIWTRKSRRKRRLQHAHRPSNASKELDVVMSYCQPHNLSDHFPKLPPDVYDPDVKVPHQGSNLEQPREHSTPRRSNSSTRQDVEEIQHVSFPPSAPTNDEPGMVDIFLGDRTTSTPSFIPPNVAPVNLDPQDFENMESRPQSPAAAHISPVVENHSLPSSFQNPLPDSSSKSSLPSLPPTPIHHAFDDASSISSRRHDSELDVISKFPLPPSSNTSQGTDEDNIIWSDVFSLEEYSDEDKARRDSSSTVTGNKSPSAPPTPTVVFTPPSPSSASLSPENTLVEGDDGSENVLCEDGKSGEDDDGNGGVLMAFCEELSTFDLANEQAGATLGLSGAGMELCPQSDRDLDLKDDHPPAYQSLKFDYEVRLVQKRSPPLPADAPADGQQSEARDFSKEPTAIVRPRPPLEEFQPLLCRKLNVLGAATRTNEPFDQGRADVANKHAGIHTPPLPVEASGAPEEQKEENAQEVVMGIAV